jgi:uncharacterized DUF497 family protein
LINNFSVSCNSGEFILFSFYIMLAVSTQLAGLPGLDEMLVEIPARTEDEPRFVVVAMISEQHWSAVLTYHGERIRIISVRQARVEEVAIYES